MLLAVGFGAAARLLREAAVLLPFAVLPEAFVLLLALLPAALPVVVAFPFAGGFFAVEVECAGLFVWAIPSSGTVKASREPTTMANPTFVQLLNIASLCKIAIPLL
jgi:hypothetical protein